MHKRVATLGVVVGALLLGACGGPSYQYLENDDEGVFAKIPGDWELISEGIIDFAVLPEGSDQMRLLPGDATMPWRVQFTSDPSGRVRVDHLAGFVEVQPVDARMRQEMRPESLIRYNPGTSPHGVPTRVSLGELEGYRFGYVIDGPDPLIADRLSLVDPRRSVIYMLQIACRQSCFDEHTEQIEEIMTTFTVEQ